MRARTLPSPIVGEPPLPRFRTPPGVILRPLRADEENLEPVLVCATCGEPTRHVRIFGGARCWACRTERRW